MATTAAGRQLEQPSLVGADGLVFSDLKCSRCASDLRHLQATGRCPECGAEVEHSLARAGSAWLRRLVRGLRLATLAFVVGLPMPALATTFIPGIPAGFIAGALMNVTALLLLAAGMWSLACAGSDRGALPVRLAAGLLVIVAIAEGIVIRQLPSRWAWVLLSQGGPLGPLTLAAMAVLLERLRWLAKTRGQADLARRAWPIGVGFFICWIGIVPSFEMPVVGYFAIAGETFLCLLMLLFLAEFGRRAARALERRIAS